MGSGPADGLSVASWPPAAMVLRVTQGALLAETEHPFTRNGEPMPCGELDPLNHGDVLALGSEELRAIASGGGQEATTVASEMDALPVRLEFQFFPRGARLHVHLARVRRKVWLSELRADLVAALLDPGDEYTETDYVDDEKLIARVWPGQPEKDKRDLNLLVHRVRRALADAGLNGKQIVERAPQGGGTRFSRLPGAPVVFLD